MSDTRCQPYVENTANSHWKVIKNTLAFLIKLRTRVLHITNHRENTDKHSGQFSTTNPPLTIVSVWKPSPQQATPASARQCSSYWHWHERRTKKLYFAKSSGNNEKIRIWWSGRNGNLRAGWCGACLEHARKGNCVHSSVYRQSFLHKYGQPRW